jgi:hypothetical protein
LKPVSSFYIRREKLLRQSKTFVSNGPRNIFHVRTILMNEYDLLLHWFSTRPHGEASAVLVGDACAALGQRANELQGSNRQSYWRYHFLDPLYRLGHVEPVGPNKWAVLPPTVLWIGGKHQEGEVHIYGARSRH